ncbi:galectin-9-like [Haliotis rubra]|uniref:galectin-9-like n=1 Tax=Haliotis rubra TaxID=36100 RepID=UPI001EE55A56|nr:galectin-9-like [Haliotis rubra]
MSYCHTIPYACPIPCGLSDGKMIIVKGICDQDQDAFSINLSANSQISPMRDTVLHFNVRFNENAIIRNSQQNDAWGQEEQEGGMPLRKGTPFEIVFLADPQYYKISVDGSHFANFCHRVPMESAQYLVIIGEVNVSYVKFEGGASCLSLPDDILPSSDLLEASSEDGRGMKSAVTSKKRSSTSDNSSTHTKKKRPSSSQKKPYTPKASTRSTGSSSQTTRTFSAEIVPMEEIGFRRTHSTPGTFMQQFSPQMMDLMEKRFTQERTLHDGQAVASHAQVKRDQCCTKDHAPVVHLRYLQESPANSDAQPMYNPPVPFTTSIPGGIYPGRILNISGIPNPDSTRFFISLMCGQSSQADIGFQFGVRFNYLDDCNQTVRNHRVNNVWGTEEKHQNYFPFVPNAEFNMTILIEEAEIKVTINNKHFCEFNHRIQPLSRVDFLNVGGDVRLVSVQIQ